MSCNGIRRGTTPGIAVVTAGDLTEYEMHLTFRTTAGLLDKTGDDLLVEYDAEADETTIGVTLSQEETLAFTGIVCEVQLRGLGPEGDAIASEKRSVAVKEILLETVLGE